MGISGVSNNQILTFEYAGHGQKGQQRAGIKFPSSIFGAGGWRRCLLQGDLLTLSTGYQIRIRVKLMPWPCQSRGIGLYAVSVTINDPLLHIGRSSILSLTGIINVIQVNAQFYIKKPVAKVKCNAVTDRKYVDDSSHSCILDGLLNALVR